MCFFFVIHCTCYKFIKTKYLYFCKYFVSFDDIVSFRKVNKILLGFENIKMVKE